MPPPAHKKNVFDLVWGNAPAAFDPEESPEPSHRDSGERDLLFELECPALYLDPGAQPRAGQALDTRIQHDHYMVQ